jgi:hypothetical protein
MKRTQSGMTLIGFIIVLGVAGVFAYVGMKVVPMYLEYFAVKQALDGLAKDGVAEKDAAKIRDFFFRRLDVSYADNVKQEHVKLQRRDAGWLMTVDYEIRKPLIANLDVVGKFHAEKVLGRVAGD